MDNVDEEAERIIRSHVIWAIGGGLLPVPLLDIAAVTLIQLDMMKQLARLYGAEYSETSGKAWVSALTGSLGSRIAANALKLIPGFGSVVGGVTMAALSGASTYAIGEVARQHFATGRAMSDLDVEAAKAKYEQELEKGKKVAKDLQKPEAREVYEKLEKLAELRTKGVITEADFEAQKQRLLASL